MITYRQKRIWPQKSCSQPEECIKKEACGVLARCETGISTRPQRFPLPITFWDDLDIFRTGVSVLLWWTSSVLDEEILDVGSQLSGSPLVTMTLAISPFPA